MGFFDGLKDFLDTSEYDKKREAEIQQHEQDLFDAYANQFKKYNDTGKLAYKENLYKLKEELYKTIEANPAHFFGKEYVDDKIEKIELDIMRS